MWLLSARCEHVPYFIRYLAIVCLPDVVPYLISYVAIVCQMWTCTVFYKLFGYCVPARCCAVFYTLFGYGVPARCSTPLLLCQQYSRFDVTIKHVTLSSHWINCIKVIWRHQIGGQTCRLWLKNNPFPCNRIHTVKRTPDIVPGT